MNNTHNWIWKGKSIPIEKLHINQLKTIIKTLENNPSNWFGRSADDWQYNINNVLRHKTNINRANNYLDKITNNKLNIIKYGT
jgi:hypothetical protein